jgi:hypothetical protein
MSDLPPGFALDDVPGLPAGFDLDPEDARPSGTNNAYMRSTAEQLAHSFGVGVRDVAEGVASLPGLAYDAAALPINAAISGANALFGTELPRVNSAAQNTGAALTAAGLPEAETTQERIVGGAVRGAASALPSMGTGLALQGAAALPAAARAVGGQLAAMPASQAVSGAAGGAVTEATGSPMLGAAAALAAPAAGAFAARAVTPIPAAQSPGRRALVEQAARERVPLSIGQQTGSPFILKLEQRLSQMPQTEARAAAEQQVQDAAFNAAVMRRTGEEAASAGPEVIRAAKARAGGVIGEMANRNTLRVTPEMDAQLAQFEDSLQFVPSQSAEPLRARIAQIRGMMRPDAEGGVGMIIPGAAYREMDTELGQAVRNAGGGDLRAHLTKLREGLRSAMDASISPEDAASWQQARREYANIKVVEKAMGGAGAGIAEGNVSPQSLRAAIGGERYATGTADLEPLARLGQSVLRRPTDSGSPAGMAVNGLLSGAGPIANSAVGAAVGTALGSPMAGVIAGAAYSHVMPKAVQSALLNPLIQAYLRNQALSPQQIQAIRGLRNNLLLQQGGAYAGSDTAEMPPTIVYGQRPNSLLQD